MCRTLKWKVRVEIFYSKKYETKKYQNNPNSICVYNRGGKSILKILLNKKNFRYENKKENEKEKKNSKMISNNTKNRKYIKTELNYTTIPINNNKNSVIEQLVIWINNCW